MNNNAGVRNSLPSNTLTVTKDTTPPTLTIYWDNDVTYTDETILGVTATWCADSNTPSTRRQRTAAACAPPVPLLCTVCTS